MALPPSTAPALDFEQLLARDLQDHRPANVSRMVPRERFVKDTTVKPVAEVVEPIVTSEETVDPDDSANEQASMANKLVRTLVATTPAFVRQLEARQAAADEEEKDDNWKASLANRTRLLLEELTGSSPSDTPALSMVIGKFDPKLHEVEMGDWESKIEWEGLKEDTNNGDGHSSNATVRRTRSPS